MLFGGGNAELPAGAPFREAATTPVAASKETARITRSLAAMAKGDDAKVVQIASLPALNGDAKWLEISAAGLEKYGELIKMFREFGLEIAGGMKADAATTKGVESGRALEILYQSLLLVVKRWRIALGNRVFLPLIALLLTGIDASLLDIDGIEAKIPADTTMRLVWPNWMTPSGADLNQTASAWQTLAGGSQRDPVPLLPRATVTRLAAGNLGFTDPSTIADELATQIEDDEKKAAAEADAQAQRDAAHQPTVPAVGA